MADVLLSSLLETIFSTLTSTALQQFGIAWGLETELKNLKSTLSTIQTVLVDAEAKQWTSEPVKNWLRKLKDSAYDAEDVLDEFATEALKRELDSQIHRVSAFLSRPNRLIFRLKMGNKIKDVVERLDKIAMERSRFHLTEGLIVPEFRSVEGRQTSSFVNESEILGRNDEKERIINMLLDDLSDRDGVSVYAVCGMGGLGKTTLAKLVYNDKRVKGHFDLITWVCVSDDFDIKRLTRAIIESIEKKACDITNLDPLQCRLQEKLSGRRYLLVLDDVWNEYHEKWDRLKDVLRCGAKGSKVVVTTRSLEVARIMATLPVHHMVVLSEDDSWSLFEQRAFDNQRMEENHELFQIGKAIVKKCGGLPLAIKALGSLLKSKSSKSKWLSVRDSKIWDLPADGSTILPALRLSYDNLPPHLRQCFAYCCIFVKDSEMVKDTLIELWMANGFIPSKGETTLHDTGHEIFNDLVWRSFLQDVQENHVGKTVCKMHDLMHDLALSIMQYELYVTDSHKDLKIPGKVRHLLVNSHSAGGVTLNEAMVEFSSLRSFVLCQKNTSFFWEEVSPWISKQKYLRVLDLRSVSSFEKVPRLISNSNHLRYLDMSYTFIEYVPESVCDLQNLETLKLENCCRLEKLPKGMRYMRNLIYLDIKGCGSLISMPPKLGQLTSLRRLSIFIVGQAEGYRIGELKELNLAGELEIKELDNVRSPADAENANLKRKHDLVSLNLRWTGYKEENLPSDVEGVLESLQPHSNLKKLSISNYRGSKFPNWMMCSVLKNLVELSLYSSLYSYSGCEQLPPLGKLHFLKILNINGMYSVKCFDPECYGDGEISFQALETLDLQGMQSLEEWTTMDRQDVFPRLRELLINSCPKLTNLPALPTLKRLRIWDNEMLLKSVNNLTSLSFLDICNFQLEILPDGLFQNHEALESLTLQCMPNIKTLQNQMSGLSSLKRLELRDCPKLGNLTGLEILNSLDSLDIYKCDSLTDLKGLESLTSLRSLYIQHCPKLRSLSEGMQHLTVLQELVINGSPEIQSFPEGMRHLNSLQSMRIMGCEGLITLPNWLGSLQSLSCLGIWSCSNLRSMPDGLRGQKNLRQLWIRWCPDLERRCKKERGEDWLKIAHIPIICIDGELVQCSLDD